MHTIYESIRALGLQHLITVLLFHGDQLQDLHSPQPNLNIVLHESERFDQGGWQITEPNTLVNKRPGAAGQIGVRAGAVGKPRFRIYNSLFQIVQLMINKNCTSYS